MDEHQDTTENPSRDFGRWLTGRNILGIVALYVGIYAAVGVALHRSFGEITNAGIFGDMFGSFNAFVSGLAMLGVIGAILLQMDQNRMQAQELKLQRLELELTRAELQGQKEALQEQNEQARRTAEAAIMSQLMREYDGMRNDIRIVQRFYEDSRNPEQALEAFRRGRTALDQNNLVATTLDQSRFEVSRFFVRVRKLSTGGYLSRRIIWRVIGRQAIEDVFLNLVDPLDQVVNQIAGNPRSMADHDFFRQLLADRQRSNVSWGRPSFTLYFGYDAPPNIRESWGYADLADATESRVALPPDHRHEGVVPCQFVGGQERR